MKNKYKAKKSDCSCSLDDVKGVIFGGISSRFWLYRKFIIYRDSHCESNKMQDHSHKVNYDFLDTP